MENAIFVIKPYDYHGTWVFDDVKVDLEKEPFISGIPEIIDHYTKDLKDPKSGFTAFFSRGLFPGVNLVLVKINDELKEGWYHVENNISLKGWLCPALLKYFSEPPKKIYIRIEK